MKKIFTLLVALFSLTAVFAQQGSRYDNSYDRRNSSTVYNSGHQGSYGNYGQQSNWNDNRYGRDDRRNDYDQRRNDYDRRDSRYNDRNRVVVTRTQTKTDLKTVAGALIIGGILGALLSH